MWLLQRQVVCDRLLCPLFDKKKLFTSATTLPLLSSPAFADFQIFSSPCLSKLSLFLPCLNKELYLSKPDQDSISRPTLWPSINYLWENGGLYSQAICEHRYDRRLDLQWGMPHPHFNPSHTHLNLDCLWNQISFPVVNETINELSNRQVLKRFFFSTAIVQYHLQMYVFTWIAMMKECNLLVLCCQCCSFFQLSTLLGHDYLSQDWPKQHNTFLDVHADFIS